MAFEHFSKIRQSSKLQKHVTINKYGQISIPPDLRDKHFPDSKWAFLMYDRERNVIGIKPSKTREVSTYNLTMHSSRRYLVVCSMRFVRFLGITEDLPKRFIGRWNEKEKLIELSEPRQMK